jgi:hypothetical protein
MLSGCRHPQPEMQRCVDEHNVVVDDKLCQTQQGVQQQRRPDGHGGFLPIFIPYHYYYGGYGGYGLGSVVGGGGYTPMTGHAYANASGRSSGTVRGGFGSSFGEGGAHGGGSGE